jgi:glycosyltransferase involved in cell wall biosynthesis
LNTVFVSRNHAERHGSSAFVLNGLLWNDYAAPNWKIERKHLVFLGAAHLKTKNLAGSKRIARNAGLPLVVLGGNGIAWKGVRYEGQVNENQKSKWLNQGLALLFPVLWQEPFGLAIIEALYYGNPVLGTPRGALPELVLPPFGFLSESEEELAQAAQNLVRWNREACHSYAATQFNHLRLAADYLAYYEKVVSGQALNTHLPGGPGRDLL